MDTGEYYKVQDVAHQLQVSSATVYAWIRQGSLPSVKIGGTRRVPVEAVERLMNKSRAKHELQLTIPVEHEVYDMLQALATKQGKPFSETCRQLLADAVKQTSLNVG